MSQADDRIDEGLWLLPRAALLDFDGTIVRGDMTRFLTGLNGNRGRCKEIDVEFRRGERSAHSALIERTNLLTGISLDTIREHLDPKYLMPGAQELFEFFRQEGIVTMVASASITPVLEYYQELLGIDHVRGMTPIVEGGVIRGIEADDVPRQLFKLSHLLPLLTDLGIPISETVALGHSGEDKAALLHAGVSIAVNPVDDLDAVADYVVRDDLREVIPLLEIAD